MLGDTKDFTVLIKNTATYRKFNFHRLELIFLAVKDITYIRDTNGAVL